MENESGFERIVFFSDAVVAIAATLLVLPLVDTANDLGGGTSVGDLLSDNSDKLVAFLISFVVIARFWMVHHTIFSRIDRETPGLVVANFVWLLSIAFLPFPTELLGKGLSGSDASTFYIATMVVTAVAATAMQWIIMRNPQVQRTEVRGTLSIVPTAVPAATMLLGLVLSATIPAVGAWALLLLIPSGQLEGILRRRRQAPPGDDRSP